MNENLNIMLYVLDKKASRYNITFKSYEFIFFPHRDNGCLLDEPHYLHASLFLLSFPVPLPWLRRRAIAVEVKVNMRAHVNTYDPYVAYLLCSQFFTAKLILKNE